MVESVLRQVDPSMRIKIIRASVKKHERAIPVVTKYQQGRVHHVGDLAELESEMYLYVPGDEDRHRSPNRMDALVHAIRYLLVDRVQRGVGLAIRRRIS